MIDPMSAHPELAPQLAALQADFAMRLPQDIHEAMARADTELAASRLIDRALNAGQLTPYFAGPDVNGVPARLSRFEPADALSAAIRAGGRCRKAA